MKYLLLLLTLLSILSAQCSLRRVALEYGDYFAYRKIHTYFDLTREQKDWTRAKTKEIWETMRRQEFPNTAQTLDDLARRWELGLTHGDLIWMEKRYVEFRIRFFDRIADDAGILMAQLNAEQKENLVEELEELLEKPQKRLALSDEKYKADLFERYEKNAEYWLGAIRKEQLETIVDKFGLRQSDLKKQQIDHQKAWQVNFLALVNTGKSPTAIAATIRAWSVNPHLMRNEPPASHDLWIQRIRNIFLTVNDFVDAEQRQHAAKKIRELARDLRSYAL